MVQPCSNNLVLGCFLKDWCDNVRKAMDQRDNVWIFQFISTNKDKLMNHWKIYQTFSTKFRWWSQMNSKGWINKSTLILIDWIMILVSCVIDLHNDKSLCYTCNFFLSAPKKSDRPAADLKRHSYSIHSWNSNGMLAPHCSSNSRCALSDSCHLHVIPHIRFYTQG